MSYNKQEPIVLISGFKAGTWLMRKILLSITSMNFYEPEIIPGEKKYYNPKMLKFKENHFYSWHLVPTDEIVDKLNNHQAKTIFVVRNIYDLVISIYYHFYNDIDADIGRGNKKDTFLSQFSFEDGLSLIITGFEENGLRWNGIIEVIDHYNEIFKASLKLKDNIIINYDKLVSDKEKAVKEIINFLDVNISKENLESIIDKSSFNAMKKDAQLKGKGESHFRTGKVKSNREQLSLVHKIQLRQMIKITAPDIYENAKSINFTDIVLD